MNTPFNDGDDNAEHLDLSFGDGPAHRPLDDRITAGRRALLRQRLFSGVAAAAVLAVVGTTYAVSNGGGETAGGIDPAAAPSTIAPTPEPAPADDDSACELSYATSTEPVLEAVPAPLGEVGIGTDAPSAGAGGGAQGGGTDPGAIPEPPVLPSQPGDVGAGDDSSISSEPATPVEPGTAEPPDLPMLPVPNGTAIPVAPGEDPFSCSGDTPAFTDTPGITLGDGAGLAGYAYVGPLDGTESDVPVLDDGAPAGLTTDGDLVAGPGVTVLREVSNPLELEAPNHSLGFAYTLAGAKYWGLATMLVSDDGTCGQWTLDQQAVAESASASLEAWLAQPTVGSGFAAEPMPRCDENSSSSSGYSSVQVVPDASAGSGSGPNPGGVDDTTGKP